jgi:hypothetical protein
MVAHWCLVLVVLVVVAQVVRLALALMEQQILVVVLVELL